MDRLPSHPLESCLLPCGSRRGQSSRTYQQRRQRISDAQLYDVPEIEYSGTLAQAVATAAHMAKTYSSKVTVLVVDEPGVCGADRGGGGARCRRRGRGSRCLWLRFGVEREEGEGAHASLPLVSVTC